MSEPLIDIRPDHWAIVADILRRHVPDREVWAFGSRATWNAKEYSDLDLAVIGETPLNLSVSAALADDFAESDLPFKVDVVDWATTSESFRKIIERDKVVVQERKGRSLGTGGVSHRSALGDYFTLQRGTTYKSQLLGQPGPVLLGLATIQRNGGFRRDSLQTYGGDSPDKLLVQPGELYLSLKDVTQSADLLGAVAKLPLDHPPGRLTQDTVKLEPKGTDVPLDYLYWLLRTPQYRRYCRAHATGTTNLGLAREDFLAFPAPEPTPMQCRIVDTLDKLDDKIELNRQMNDTLEAMARALFKSWFVDFDPVRAKQAKNVGWVSPSGRNPPNKADDGLRGYAANPPYKLPPHIADLFPDRFEDSGLGEIPAEWQVAPLPDVIEVNPTRSLRRGEVAPYLDMANMPTRGHSPNAVIERAFGSGMRFVNGDTLVARITPCLENGKTAYVDFLQDGQVGWGSTEYIVLHPKPPLPAEFAYCLARSNEFRDFAIQSMTGSSGRQRVPAESLSHFQIVAPPKSISEHFGRLIKPLFARASAATKASRTLAALRDTLLPRLISGELRVKDAERVAVGET
ncbi:MAG: nucleotidyltransferase domain-containing protein [bacterium]